MESIAALTQLETLNMGGAIVSDVGMKSLQSLVNLQSLDLSRMEITAVGLEPILKMPKLRRLNLWQCSRINDKAVAYLKSVEELDLGDTGVTDATLDQLQQNKRLKVLAVSGTKVTAEGLDRFRKARPDCRLLWSPKFKDVKSEEDTRLTG